MNINEITYFRIQNCNEAFKVILVNRFGAIVGPIVCSRFKAQEARCQ
jgi:hypothetical protein